MRTRIGAVLAAALVALAGVFTATGPASATPATAQACDLQVAQSVNYSALMLYVGARFEGCDTSVMEISVDLKFAASEGGPYTTVDSAGVYSGGAAWFDGSYGCGWYVGTALWQGQSETTPQPTHYCT